jgi:hypothetical protein
MRVWARAGAGRSIQAVLASALLALALSGCGGSRGPSGTDVEVTGAGPEGTVFSGSTATFRMSVRNIGINSAGEVKLVNTVGNGLTVTDVRCSAAGGGICPETADVVVTLPSLGVGAVLVFEIDAAVSPLINGTVTNTMVATLNDDVNRINNSATATASAAVSPPDPSGSYRVYAADGREYEMAIDFTAGSYTMSGNGATTTSNFTAGSDGTYVVSGDQRLRTAADLIVGSHAFPSGVLPYVAARSFVTSAGAIAGAFNLMTRNVAPDGASALTRAGTARASGNILQVCEDDFEVVQPQACGVGALKSYLLSVSGDLFTGVETTSGETIAFRVARSNAAPILLSTGPTTQGDAMLQWRIGLQESSGIAGGTVFGPAVYADRSTDWLEIELTRSTYAALGGKINDVAALGRESALSPVAILQGNAEPGLGGAPIWVMQAYPLVVVIGATKAPVGVPSASGMLQIGVP